MQRFVTTSDATQAMSSGRAGTTSARVRPGVHVTLWRSVADGIDAGTRRQGLKAPGSALRRS